MMDSSLLVSMWTLKKTSYMYKAWGPTIFMFLI